jgi:hypothetical protein
MADSVGFIKSILGSLPVLKKDKNAGLAAIIGLLVGCIGIGIYFGSLLDFAIGFLVVIVALALLHTGGVLVGAAFAGIYGALRVLDSNKRRADEAKLQPQPAVK